MRPALAFLLFATTLVPVAVFACGGAPPSDLLVSQDTSGAPTGTPEASAPSDATTQQAPDGPSPPADDGGDDVTAPPQEAGPIEAAVEAAVEAGPSSGLPCTNGTSKTYCQGTDVCCITGGLVSTASCGSAATCLGSTVRCTSSADCTTGEVCCSTEMTGFGTTYSVSCAPTCTGLTKSEFCDPGANGPSGCSGGQTCSASTELSGYSQCH